MSWSEKLLSCISNIEKDEQQMQTVKVIVCYVAISTCFSTVYYPKYTFAFVVRVKVFNSVYFLLYWVKYIM